MFQKRVKKFLTKRTACDKIAKLPKEQKVLEKQKIKKVVDKQNEL